ncbi:MAG: GDP-L-fucose synthase [bacterium]
MNKNAKIYVAGHTGLVGSAIISKLKTNGYTNIITRNFAELDLRNQEQVSRFFEQKKPEYVFLAAAKVGGILANNTYKAEFIYDNLMIATNIIHAAYTYNVKKLINLGSSCIYPKHAPQPIQEAHLLTGELEPTNEPYAIAKIAAIKLCKYYNEQYHTNFISVMPTNLYGPQDNFNLTSGHVLPALIRKFYLAKLLHENNFEQIMEDLNARPLGTPGQTTTNGLPNTTNSNHEQIEQILNSLGITKNHVTLWGSGEPYREFLHVKDLADALIFIINNYNYSDIGETINIGSGTDIQIKELALLIKNITGFTGDIIWDKTNPDGTPRKLLDVSKIHALGWQHKTDLALGIKNVYQDYVRQNLIKKEK